MASKEMKKKYRNLWWASGKANPATGRTGRVPWQKKLGKNHPKYEAYIEKVRVAASRRKGKSYEELYGKEKADEMKMAVSRRMSGSNHPNFGKHLSVSTRMKQRLARLGKYCGENSPRYGCSAPKKTSYGKRIKYKDIVFRSSWEAKVAEKFDFLGILWDYEPRRFEFSHKKYTYLPDFYLPQFGIYVEVKGYISPNGDVKINDFKKEHSEKDLRVISETNYHTFLEVGFT